jgi:hypothetical protein
MTTPVAEVALLTTPVDLEVPMRKATIGSGGG